MDARVEITASLFVLILRICFSSADRSKTVAFPGCWRAHLRNQGFCGSCGPRGFNLWSSEPLDGRHHCGPGSVPEHAVPVYRARSIGFGGLWKDGHPREHGDPSVEKKPRKDLARFQEKETKIVI